MLINKKSYPKPKVVDTVIFESDSVTIYLERNETYGFDINNKLFTNDILEAVSYLMKFPNLQNEDFWQFTINENMLYHINPMNTVYWLSGGDEFWDNWEYNWVENIDLYSIKWEKKIISLKNVKTLSDIRDFIQTNFNLDEFYEFALSKQIV